MTWENAAASVGQRKKEDKMGPHFRKLQNPSMTPRQEGQDEDKRLGKGRVVGFYKVSQGGVQDLGQGRS